MEKIEQNNTTMSNFPKLECPFVRKMFKVDKDSFQQHRKNSHYQLRKPEVYLVINQINPGFEWVFNDADTIAVEKLDGTNVKIFTIDGRLVAIQNRKNIIDPQLIVGGQTFVIEGIVQSATSAFKGYVNANGEQCGELLGPKLNGNRYNLDGHIWYPFDKAIQHLVYRSYDTHKRTFDQVSEWMKELISKFYRKNTKPRDKDICAEGVVFYNLRRKAEGNTWRAKLRRDMFVWYYEPKVSVIEYSSEI